MPKTHRSAGKKTAHRLHHRLGLLEMGKVSSPVDEFGTRSGNSPGEFLRIGQRDDAVRLAPDDQRRRCNAVDAILKSAIGDRPDELAGAGQASVILSVISKNGVLDFGECLSLALIVRALRRSCRASVSVAKGQKPTSRRCPGRPESNPCRPRFVDMAWFTQAKTAVCQVPGRPSIFVSNRSKITAVLALAMAAAIASPAFAQSVSTPRTNRRCRLMPDRFRPMSDGHPMGCIEAAH
jgi:hypothetical protein